MPSLQHTVLTWLIPVLRRNLSADDVPAMRRAMTEANRDAQEAPPHDVSKTHEVSISNDHGFPVFSWWPAGTEAPRRSLLYLHGGAYVRPADQRHWRFATHLADTLGARAVLPAYPLAPEFTVEDSFAALVQVFEE